MVMAAVLIVFILEVQLSSTSKRRYGYAPGEASELGVSEPWGGRDTQPFWRFLPSRRTPATGVRRFRADPVAD
jgi:hypothetical protein